MIEASYICQNPHRTPAAARAIVQGQEMVATVDAFEVQLVAENMANSGITLRFVGDQIAGAEELFQNDARITAIFGRYQEKKEGEQPPPAPNP